MKAMQGADRAVLQVAPSGRQRGCAPSTDIHPMGCVQARPRGISVFASVSRCVQQTLGLFLHQRQIVSNFLEGHRRAIFTLCAALNRTGIER